MKNKLILLPFLLSLFLIQGCAGGLIVVAGTAVAISSDERSISTQLADDALSIEALNKINELNLNKENMRINLISNNGYLLVIGQVTDESNKQIIEEKLNTIKDVKEVYNQLRIGKPIGFTQQSKDSWITTKAKSQLTAHDEVNPFKIKVVTENGELFLIGRVDAKTADIATNIAREISGVKHVKRVFQIIPE
jgi:osmotically-inducible protein OsmY